MNSSISSQDQLQLLQAHWLALASEENGRAKQDEFYAKHFAPSFIPIFVELPLRGVPHDMNRPEYLMSVLGLSWQPVALMAAWCRPKHCLILGSAESFKQSPFSSEKPLERISRLAKLPPAQIEWHQISENDELDMYRYVRDFLTKHRIQPRTAALDITGGKKSMSASAALAGFLTGCPIVYVDYAEYVDRIPLAGTEFPRLLDNPLEIFGDLEFGHIKSAFSRGDFGEAERRSRELSERLYSPRKAELYEKLSRAYGHWANFRFADASRAMSEALAILHRFQQQQNWSWAPSLSAILENHLSVTKHLDSIEEKPARLDQSMAVVLNHLAAGVRAGKEGRSSIAILLFYSTLERFVDLALWTEYGLDDDAPNYALVTDKLNLPTYHECGRIIMGRGKYEERELGGKIMLSNGMQLLAALNPMLLPRELLKEAPGFLNARNKCEYEHGFKAKPLKPEDLDKWYSFVHSIISVQFGGGEEGKLKLNQELARFEFPALV